MALKIRFSFTDFQKLIPEKYPAQIRWNVWTRKSENTVMR